MRAPINLLKMLSSPIESPGIEAAADTPILLRLIAVPVATIVRGLCGIAMTRHGMRADAVRDRHRARRVASA